MKRRSRVAAAVFRPCPEGRSARGKAPHASKGAACKRRGGPCARNAPASPKGFRGCRSRTDDSVIALPKRVTGRGKSRRSVALRRACGRKSPARPLRSAPSGGGRRGSLRALASLPRPALSRRPGKRPGCRGGAGLPGATRSSFCAGTGAQLRRSVLAEAFCSPARKLNNVASRKHAPPQLAISVSRRYNKGMFPEKRGIR